MSWVVFLSTMRDGAIVVVCLGCRTENPFSVVEHQTILHGREIQRKDHEDTKGYINYLVIILGLEFRFQIHLEGRILLLIIMNFKELQFISQFYS